MISEEHSSLEEVRDLLDTLDDKWELLGNNVKDKEKRLEQATRARAFSNATDDLQIWCDQTENLLSSSDFGDDLSSVKFLRNKHQVSLSNQFQVKVVSYVEVRLNSRSCTGFRRQHCSV